MTRIDHVAEARALMVQADAYTSSDMVIQTGEVKADVIAAAQFHATLALVEQQRIANVIALAHVADEGDVTPLERSAWLTLGYPHTGAMRPDIAAALGIGDAP